MIVVLSTEIEGPEEGGRRLRRTRIWEREGETGREGEGIKHVYICACVCACACVCVWGGSVLVSLQDQYLPAVTPGRLSLPLTSG